MSPQRRIYLVLLSLWELLGILGPHKDRRTNPHTGTVLGSPKGRHWQYQSAVKYGTPLSLWLAD